VRTNEEVYRGLAVTPIPHYIITERVVILSKLLKEELAKDYKDRSTKEVDRLVKDIKFWENINKGLE